jgi:8-amino-7-oxononanoate synthase
VTDFDQQLQDGLQSIRDAGLFRELRRVDSAPGTRIIIGGRTLLNFSSNDYLGLAAHPALKEAALKAVEKFGAGSGASRLICGSLAPHHELEEALAEFKGTAAALSFSTGYAAAVGTIGALLGKEDFIILDKLVHASIVDAARLCGAKLRVFDHNDLNDLEAILKWADEKRAVPAPAPAVRKPRVLVVTESVFSMDGDTAPLRDMVALKERHGAWLMVDEAHATGLFGATRRGVAEAQGVSDQIEIQMGTLGKALGAAGGYVCGSRALADLLVNRARSFIYSTAPVPAQSAAARAGLAVIRSGEGRIRCERAWANARAFCEAVNNAGRPLPAPQSAIVPLVVGGEDAAVALAAALRGRGFFVPAIRYPTVARGAARLRVTLTAEHTAQDVAELASVVSRCDGE